MLWPRLQSTHFGPRQLKHCDFEGDQAPAANLGAPRPYFTTRKYEDKSILAASYTAVSCCRPGLVTLPSSTLRRSPRVLVSGNGTSRASRHARYIRHVRRRRQQRSQVLGTGESVRFEARRLRGMWQYCSQSLENGTRRVRHMWAGRRLLGCSTLGFPLAPASAHGHHW
jgi:hypothetical protein